MTRWRQRLAMIGDRISWSLPGHPSWPHSVLCWPRLTAGQLATNHLTRNVQTSETARPLITIRDTDHTSTHLVRCYGAGVGSRDNDGALTVFICAIIQIKLDPFSGRYLDSSEDCQQQLAVRTAQLQVSKHHSSMNIAYNHQSFANLHVIILFNFYAIEDYNKHFQ